MRAYTYTCVCNGRQKTEIEVQRDIMYIGPILLCILYIDIPYSPTNERRLQTSLRHPREKAQYIQYKTQSFPGKGITQASKSRFSP